MSNSQPILELFPEDPAEKILDTDVIEKVWDVLGANSIQNLAYGGEPGRNPGYIFRGEADFIQPLQSSLEQKLRKELGDNGSIDKEKMERKERELVANFVRGDGRLVAEIIDKQSKHKISEPQSSVFWWLSVMQHYSCDLSLPTRMIDFTRDIRFALFFAIEQRGNSCRSKRLSDDLIIYCFPCKNLKFDGDRNNNKSPFTFGDSFPFINMHVAIGCQMNLPWMRSKGTWGFFEEHRKNRNDQHWGWDRPYFQNPRLEYQKGMFVYPYDYPEENLQKGESWLIRNILAGTRKG